MLVRSFRKIIKQKGSCQDIARPKATVKNAFKFDTHTAHTHTSTHLAKKKINKFCATKLPLRHRFATDHEPTSPRCSLRFQFFFLFLSFFVFSVCFDGPKLGAATFVWSLFCICLFLFTQCYSPLYYVLFFCSLQCQLSHWHAKLFFDG